MSVATELPAKVSDIELRLSTSRRLGRGHPRGIERWTAEARTPDDRVGELQVLMIDLTQCRDPWGALDSSNDDLAHIGDAVFDSNTGHLAESLDSALERIGHRVLILDRVELSPQWQGHNVAALLAAETIDELRTGVRAALCLPAPLERRADESDEDYERSVERMKGVWSQVGFRSFRSGVWLLEPYRRTLDENLARLRARHEVEVA
jgi:GNAT superfamily N-acetyltransferase